MRFASLVVGSALLLSGTAHAAYIANITIDGNQSDFNPMFQFRDRNENATAAGGGTDIPDNYDVNTVFVANNATYLYWAATTYGNITGQLRWRLYVDVNNNTTAGGAYGADDRYVEITTNNNACQDIRVYQASNDTQLSDQDCGTAGNLNAFVNGTGKFIEARIPFTWLTNTLPTAGNITVGALLTVTPQAGGTGELAPGQPLPSFIRYDNRGSAIPTFVRVRGLTAEAGQGGVAVRWRTSAEYFSAGTWVVRANGDDWVPVSPMPQGGNNIATGDSYTVVDPNGSAGDVYALVEVDSRTAVRIFGPVSATQSAVSLPAANNRLRPVALEQRRADALYARLTTRSNTLRVLRGDRDDSLLNIRQVDVDVTREGLFAVCDSDTLRYGAVPASVTLNGQGVRAFAISEPCEGLGFYAAAPTSAYAPYESYRVTLADARSLARLETPYNWQYDGAVTQATVTSVVMPRLYLDQRDGTPNRFFWSYASNAPGAPVTLPAIAGQADLTVDVHPLSGGTTHTVVVSSDHELGRSTVGDGWSRITLPNIDVANASSLSFQVDAEPSLIEVVLLADATLRYNGEPLQGDNGVHFGVTGDTWVGVRSGRGYAFDVTRPKDAGVLQSSKRAPGLAVHTMVATRDVFVGASFAKLTPTPTPIDAFIDDASSGADYLVLTPTALESTARDLALLREEEGLRTAVITYEALYARFSDGNPNPNAVNALLDWAAVRWSTQPRYLALVGSTSSDPYGYTGSLRGADAPIAESSDPLFAYRRFSDRDLVGTHDIAVGRLPTSDAAELSRYIDKLRAYRTSTPTGQWTMVNGNAGANDPSFAGLAGNIGQQVADSVAVRFLENPTTVDLVNAWGGADVIAYAGHGDAESWADDVLYTELVPNLATERPPVTMSVACMDAMTTSATGGLGWSLVSAEIGRGSIAAIGPSSIVEPIEATAFLGRVAAAIAYGEVSRWGDAWRVAQATYSSSAARSMVFIGDPALAP